MSSKALAKSLSTSIIPLLIKVEFMVFTPYLLCSPVKSAPKAETPIPEYPWEYISPPTNIFPVFSLALTFATLGSFKILTPQSSL